MQEGTIVSRCIKCKARKTLTIAEAMSDKYKNGVYCDKDFMPMVMVSVTTTGKKK